MTYGDIFVQIVHEATGLTKQDIETVLRAALAAFPGRVSFDQELTDQKAVYMLDSLRKDRSSILMWCVRAGLMSPTCNPGNA
jgi:hypothetical protein